MTNKAISIKPELPPNLLEKLAKLLHELIDIPPGTSRAAFLGEQLTDFEPTSLEERRYRCILLLLRDLFAQGWEIHLQRGEPYLRHPSAPGNTTKDWYRMALIQERDKQLRESSIIRFVRSMERVHFRMGQRNSIRDLIANPHSLLDTLTVSGASSVRPYLQIIKSKLERDPFTGFRLHDIWRYFRLTWTIPYKATPGRKIYILVRDASQMHHPIMGIAALGNSIIQLTCRDKEIGWMLESLQDRVKTMDDYSAARVLLTLHNSLQNAIMEVAVDDLIPGDITLSATDEVIEFLSREVDKISISSRPEHVTANARPEVWAKLSQTPLYRKKRALTLIGLLRATKIFEEVALDPPMDAIHRLLSTAVGRSAVAKALQANKKEKIGVNMMDIIVCGAIPPYNHLLAGKLVSLLMMSPEVTRAYEERYRDSISVIASGMKGHPVVRDSRLVFLGTTSLYETCSSQYNRVSLPSNVLGPGCPSQKICYRKLGLTKGYGTVYLSDETVNKLSELIQLVHGTRLSFNTYGEGTSPRLRLIRTGLDLLGLPSKQLLRHNFKRIVYGVELAENTYAFLRGEEETPNYCLNQEQPREVSEAICEFWKKRWLFMRLQNQDILDRVRMFQIEKFLLGNYLKM